MKAVIIAGGLGTRLRPLTYKTPKPIVPVANRPFVLHQIELLKQHGIREIILNLHYLSGDIENILGDGSKFGVKIYYSLEKDPLGTAGAVKNAEEFFDGKPMLVLNGDTLTDTDLSAVIDFHKKKKATVTLTLVEVEDPAPYGLVLMDQEGRVTNFIEKPRREDVSPPYNINAGIYVLDPKIFQDVPAGVPYSFERQLYPELLERGEPIYGFISHRYWIDIGNAAQYRCAHEAILQGKVKAKVSGTRKGLSLWGKNVKIGKGCKIKDYVVIGDNVAIGDNCALDHVIIWEGAQVGNNVNLENCILGNGHLVPC